MEVDLEITDAAEAYLADLVAKREEPGMAIRIWVMHPGTPHAECAVAYWHPADQREEDLRLQYGGFDVHVDPGSVRYLAEAVIDFEEDKLGGQLTIRAPNAKMPKVDADSPLEDRINYVLYNDVNPQLAAHGGQVMLVEVVEDSVAVLQFGGGCQGCSAVDMTLKDGVEKTLMAAVPDLKGVRDATDHSYREQAFYR